MASTSETGHAKNVANLNVIISRCTGYGGRYNPSNPSLTLPNLQNLYNNSFNAIEAISPLKQPFITAVNERQVKYAAMEKLTTKIVNALDASAGVSDEIVNDAKTIVRKIRGARKGTKKKLVTVPTPPTGPGPIPPTPIEDPVTISVSQQSYDQQYQHFSQLLALVAAQPTYTPNEVELQTATLTIFKNDLNTANQNVVSATTPYLQALATRDSFLYTPETGLVDTAYEVKKYVKSVPSITSAEFKQISGLKFTRPRKKS
ncbi:MAG: hypothetical protein AB7G44_01625 [Bacteroidia bacterium]